MRALVAAALLALAGTAEAQQLSFGPTPAFPGSVVSGSGTTGQLATWASSSTLGSTATPQLTSVNLGIAPIAGVQVLTQTTAHAGATFSILSRDDTTANLFFVRDDGVISMPKVPQTSAAQTGTVCWNSSNLTIDTTTTCLASNEQWKDTAPFSESATAILERLQPISYKWKTAEVPEKARADPGPHIGLGAIATAYADDRLIARNKDGQPRAWREDAMIALLVAGFKEQQAQIDALRVRSSR